MMYSLVKTVPSKISDYVKFTRWGTIWQGKRIERLV